jgi:uncharacterized protein (DUF1330 family)
MHTAVPQEKTMPKAYWVVTYHRIDDPEALAAYAMLAAPAVVEGGGRFLARGMPQAVREAGVMERVVLVEFDSMEAAEALYESAAYQRARAHLDGGAVHRELRIVPGA